MTVNKTKKKNKGGRPLVWDTKKCNELAKQMDVYFEGFLKRFKEEKDFKEIPFISAFCREAGVSQETLVNKTDNNTKLFGAYKKAKKIQREILMLGGLNGRFNPTAFIFIAKNITDLRDKVEVPIDKDGNDVYITGFRFVSRKQYEEETARAGSST